MPATEGPGSPLDRLARRPLALAGATAVIGLPLVVAVVALAGRRWYPVLDLAMTEFRLRDVGTTDTPLIGLPGRIGELPEQGSHPGPLSFWLLAPGYRLFGSSAWAMEVAAVGLHLVWAGTALWIGARRRGAAGVAAVALVLALMIRGFGLTVLIQPWNPYLPLVAFLVVVLATWSVLCDDHWMLVPLVVAASFAAQTHIPYLTMAGGLGVVAFVVAGTRWWRGRREREREPASEPERVGEREPAADTRPLAWTLAAFGALWLIPLAEELVRDPGNLTRLADHFGSPPEEAIGVVAGLRLLLRHLDPTPMVRSSTGDGEFLLAGFDPDGAIWPGAVLLAVWIVAVASARRLGHRPLLMLHATVGVALLLAAVSMSRIFGLRWFYLTLWAWVTTAVLLVATVWTGLAALRRVHAFPEARLSRTRAAGVVAGLAVVLTALSVAAAPSTDHPEERLSDTLGELVGPTDRALTEAGVTGPVLVDFDDAYFFGSQAFGLVSELERAGWEAGMISYWRVPATSGRVVEPSAAVVKVVLVTGGFVADWRADPRVAEVVTVDPRTPDERRRFDELREAHVAELDSGGLADLVAVVDTNLFGLNVDLRISERARELSGEMIALGQETAVFLTAPDVVPESRA